VISQDKVRHTSFLHHASTKTTVNSEAEEGSEGHGGVAGDVGPGAVS